MKIAVAGTGYVGLSIATLLAQHHEVTAVDIVPEKVDLINRRQSPIQDEYIEKYFAKDRETGSHETGNRETRNQSQKPFLNLTATLDAEAAYKDAEFVVIAAPTNYDSRRNPGRPSACLMTRAFSAWSLPGPWARAWTLRPW